MERKEAILKRKNKHLKNLNITTGSILIFNDFNTGYNIDTTRSNIL